MRAERVDYLNEETRIRDVLGAAPHENTIDAAERVVRERRVINDALDAALKREAAVWKR